MASTLAEMSRMALAHDFRHIDPKSARILLYEAGPRILPTYPEHLSVKAQRHLESLGVKIYINARVTRVDSEGIVVGQQRIEAATVLWGSGCYRLSRRALAGSRNRQVRKDYGRARPVGIRTSRSICHR